MAHASKKRIGAGSQGKGPGTGASASVPKEMIGENMVLSNRDKSRHSKVRGLDSREIQNEQLQDNARNRLNDEEI
ncbi:MAG: hypothetical protein WBX25_31280 [Rhodomicrobium sp.]